MTIPLWTNEPTILLNKSYIFEIWPLSSMSYEQKINAITRFIIIATILGYILTQSLNILLIGIFTLCAIFAFVSFQKKKITNESVEEGFGLLNNEASDFINNSIRPEEQQQIINPETLDTFLKSEFKEGTRKNPFSNVLLTEINDEPERKAAPPSFNTDVSVDITTNVKRAIQRLNPTIKSTNKQLFGDLWQNFQLDKSNRAFYSTPNTRVSNDQGAFAQYLYGYMPSAKESTPDGNMQRVADNYRYILY
jgi:hypothetical protein